MIGWRFSAKNENEYIRYLEKADMIGTIIKDTETGPIFKLSQPIVTGMRKLYIIKVRKPDKTKLQRGDADYRIANYEAFKHKHLTNACFR